MAEPGRTLARFKWWVLLGLVVVVLGVATRARASVTAGRVLAADRGSMDATQRGPSSGLRDIYEFVDAGTGHLIVVASDGTEHSAGPLLAWSPVLAYIDSDSTFGGFGPDDPYPLVGSGDGPRTDLERAWLGANRTQVFVASLAEIEATDASLRVRWRNRTLEAELIDVDPSSRLAVIAAVLDDDREQGDEWAERSYSVVGSGLDITEPEMPVFARGLQADRESTRGFVTARVRGTPDDRPFDEIRGVDGALKPGSPVGFGFFVDQSEAVIGIVSESCSVAEWCPFTVTPVIDAFVADVCRSLADPRDGDGYLGVATHTSDGGAVIDDVVSGSPAAGAGLRIGDRIVGFGGAKTPTKTALLLAIRDSYIGQAVALVVDRGGLTVQLLATPSERPR